MLTVKEFCDKFVISKEQFFGKIPISKNCSRFNNLEEIPEGFNPWIRGSLILDKVKKLPKGFNPYVTGFMILKNIKEIEFEFQPTVLKDLCLFNLDIKNINENFKPVVNGEIFVKTTNNVITRYKNV